MSAPKHTAGWQVSENADGRAVVITPNSGDDAERSHYDFVVVCTLTKHAIEDRRARLIAAAPDLLEALIALKAGAVLPGGVNLGQLAQAEAAIAKATGADQ